ncbi:hypothetical protein ASV53_19900 [Photobacterium sanguinicancri]|uniref:protein-N(pi)-phosphohistidine--D-fructose phosphotransferase n=1 Tax=Photobacterium sanguinicancri TaxID=875932 RepID=A0ABX4FWG9_9GAMM|nr:hypothetical protein ASV53_19900 [Photobacterium sanguinicancri]
MKVAIVTACPSGIANSVIAAGLLEKAAAELKWTANIECQSSVVSGNTLTAEQIEAADCVIVAANRTIDLSRFKSKKVYQSDISACLTSPKTYLENAISQADVLAVIPQVDENQASNNSIKKIVAITACPTGVAHTFMAAEALEEEGNRLGHHIKVETRGSVGAKNQLTESEIADADLVIIAADIEIDMARFAGKKVYKTSTGLALKKTKQELENAFEKGATYQHDGSSANSASTSGEKTGAYKHLMTGVCD